jgi:phage gp29-like protein
MNFRDLLRSAGAAIGIGSAPVQAVSSAPASKASPAMPPGISGDLARLLRPQAAYRWLLPQLAAITPQYIEYTLRGALAGNHVQQWELFDLMLDTWPELAACAQELTEGVMRKKMIFEPAAEEDEDPTPQADERLKLVSAALRGMRPAAAADENDLDGTVKDIIDGWFRGVTCLEIDWQLSSNKGSGQFFAPRATYWVHPVCFAFSSDGVLGLRADAMGRLSPGNLGSTSAQPQPSAVAPFPDNKFLIGIHKAKSGTALGGALLRPLAWWWCAANFSSDWLLNLAQVFGLPFRWANYDTNAPQELVNKVCDMLQNMGSAGWAAFPAGTTLELKDMGKGSDHSPQGELLDRADRYARLLLLGQTLSGSQSSSKGGGKAFGAVEKDVKEDRIESAAKYVAGVINQQLITSVLVLNYGEADEAPTVRFLEEEEGGLEEAQRDIALAAGMPVPLSFIRKKYNLPKPAKDEEVFKVAVPVKPEAGNQKPGTAAGDGEDIEPQDAEAVASKTLHRISQIKEDTLFAKALADFASTTK